VADKPSLREALNSPSWAVIFNTEIAPVVRILRRNLLHTSSSQEGRAEAFAKFTAVKNLITGMYRKADDKLPLPDAIIREFDLPNE
jgi:hypothetical protein